MGSLYSAGLTCHSPLASLIASSNSGGGELRFRGNEAIGAGMAGARCRRTLEPVSFAELHVKR